ncbi:sulfatase-like hydrolase/transferase [Litchfieldia alkalitelluris]|uniref:sulfatase-like hydrolase/transferase n=1 Tax=Litchfieldia alkalitelluris TaxID=304268 RepID=UPI001F308A5C|nr:sulfatase-like hydrolase/transferase [Litchfieldia alkalitelluris]
MELTTKALADEEIKLNKDIAGKIKFDWKESKKNQLYCFAENIEFFKNDYLRSLRIIMSKKKNIVMIVADQWRYDSIGYSGNKNVKTPNVDKLSEEGVSFSNAYCQNPVCVPSRCSFLTGLYPHTKGHRTMGHLMDDEQPNILKSLKQSGYHVYWGGRNDFLKVEGDDYKLCSTRNDEFAVAVKRYKEYLMKEKAREKDGEIKKEPEKEKEYDYSHYKGVMKGMGDTDVKEIKNAIQFLEEEKYGEDPFCMYLALSLPHPPYGTEQEWLDQIDESIIPAPVRLTDEEWEKKPSILRGIRNNQKINNWSDDRLKKMKQTYYAMGTKLDHYIGELVDSLKAKGVYDDTIVVFFSDHGDFTGDYEIAEKNQNTFEDMLTRVPLIIKPAKDTKAKPRTTNALVELIDVQATLHDLLDIEYQHTQFGKSLQHVLIGDEQHRDVVFSEGGRLEGEKHCAEGGPRSSEYWARTSEQEKIPQHTKAMMIRDENYKYVYRHYEKDEFYDMNSDPLERNNQIDNPAYAELIQGYKNRMLTHFFETSDVVPHKVDSRF